MCTGRKLWRVARSRDAEALGADVPGVELSTGRTVFAAFNSTFDTWGLDSRLETASAEVFEAVLEPDEMLYIPSGAPHAARRAQRPSRRQDDGPSSRPSPDPQPGLRHQPQRSG